MTTQTRKLAELMRRTNYVLRVKSGAWSAAPGRPLVEFSMTAECHARLLGCHNIQVVVGAPNQPQRGLNEDVLMWLDSGWWITLRNQFDQAPDTALNVIRSVEAELSAMTAEITAAGEDGPVVRKLFATEFEATGPDYWHS